MFAIWDLELKCWYVYDDEETAPTYPIYTTYQNALEHFPKDSRYEPRKVEIVEVK